MIRNIGFATIALASVAVWVTMAPPEVDPSASTIGLSTANYARLVEQALSDSEVNEELAESAPQQQVVNGWVARDLMSIIALAQADTLETLGGLTNQNETVVSAIATRDDRIPALLGLAVLAICWGGMASNPAHQRTDAMAGEVFSGPPEREHPNEPPDGSPGRVGT